ncbi:MAG: glucans biosynthesis glucosyltransferase MdoH [Methylibium sp.]|uniref:glucans biosynthesis glucosyltransferase MdoH n=1 Tax=Methylibium sp. TaxID=2067992 RepID=UPI0017B29769|nr:glucans biosynthesis glucosyltransferase MdoH [Methylibium sp.]MBA3595899.1 glucans biosynthesis glucosyltransferase MdoH [Methylibium sp.]
MKLTETISDVSPLADVATAPQLMRGSMTPRPWAGLGGSLRAGLGAALGDKSTALPVAAQASWAGIAADRRRLLLALVVGSATFATLVLESVAPVGDGGPWAGVQTGLFALLFAWVSAGCVTAVMGYLTLLRGDRHALTAAGVANHAIDPSARTAIIMPICNEDIATVAAGLRATCESLIAAQQQAGAPPVFDVYLLSDTADPKLREAELLALQALRAALGDLPVYYRWRQRRTKKKAGNVADFCRRWGRQYRYMIVLDADSVMSGEALLTMVRLMEAHPRAGIVQTAPRSCGHDSLHARVQQFAGRVSGALFSAGLRYWQLGESHYWGHNAILRVEPFMKHCALAPLAGRGGLSGPILSHDFVEAALMRRAGYEVWLVPDIEGSFEQPPPHLIDELTRDRRWCQGNLQNARLVAEPGIAGVHRAMFVTGAMSYVASPLWLAFALLGVLPWLVSGTGAGVPDGGLPMAAVGLWAATLALLFLPRVLAVRLIVQRGEAAAYGGTGKLAVSAVLEALLSALQAPVRMVAHSIFVVGALTGLKLAWKSPSREATAVGWREAAGRFGVVGALVAAALAWWMAGQPADAWRVLPLALPLMLAVPLAVVTSRTGVGRAWRRRGWLLIPEETRPPAVMQAAWRHAGAETIELPPQAEVPALPTPVAVQPAWPARHPVSGRGERGSAGSLAWPGARSVAFASFAMASVVAMMVPNTVATGGLSASDLAAMRIVMMASSPEAAPRVLEEQRRATPQRGVRRVAVKATGDAVRRVKSRPTSI